MGQANSYEMGAYPGSIGSLGGDPDGTLETVQLFPKLVKSDMLWILEKSTPTSQLPPTLELSRMKCGEIANLIGRHLITHEVCTVELCNENVQMHRDIIKRMLIMMGEPETEEETSDSTVCNASLQRRLEKVMLEERGRRIMAELVKELETVDGNGSIQSVVELQMRASTRNLELFKWVSEKEAPWTFKKIPKQEDRDRVRALLQHFEDQHALIKVKDDYQQSHAFRTALMRWVLYALWAQAPPFDITEDLEWKLKHSKAVLLEYPEALVPGDMLSRKISLHLKHYGIYVGGVSGQHFVVDFDTDSRVRETAEVYIHTIKEFALVEKVHVRRFKKLRPIDLIQRRVTLALLQRLSGAQTRYKLVQRNCETFASLIKMGRMYCQQSTVNPLNHVHTRLTQPANSELYRTPTEGKELNVSNKYCEGADCESCRVTHVQNMLIFGRIRENTLFPCHPLQKDVLSSRYGYSATVYADTVRLVMAATSSIA